MDVLGLSRSWSNMSILSVEAARVLSGCIDMLADMHFRYSPFLKAK